METAERVQLYLDLTWRIQENLLSAREFEQAGAEGRSADMIDAYFRMHEYVRSVFGYTNGGPHPEIDVPAIKKFLFEARDIDYEPNDTFRSASSLTQSAIGTILGGLIESPDTAYSVQA